MIVASIVLGSFNFSRGMTRSQIEEKAKSYGMDYPSEFKVIMNKGEGK
jgi:hypothetical protein